MLILINNLIVHRPALIKGNTTKNTRPEKSPMCTHLSKYSSSKKVTWGKSLPGRKNKIFAIINQIAAGINSKGFNFISAQK